MCQNVDKEFYTKTLDIICGNCGYKFVVSIDCGDRTCPECARKRKSRILDSLYPHVKDMKSPKFLTLTVVNPKLTRANVAKIRRQFTQLRHRQIWKGVKGGFYNIEIGELDENNNCNLHMHILYDGPYIPQKEISKIWLKITKNSRVVDIRKVYDHIGAMWYLSTHFCKVVYSENEDQVKLVNMVLKGTRLVQGFGHLRFLKTEKNTQCPECHAENSFYSGYSALFFDVLQHFEASEYDHCPA